MTNAIKLYKNTDTDKRVGINWSTGNPAYNLDVNGNANISSDLFTGGSISIHRASGTTPYLEINNQTYSMGPYINGTNRGLYDWGSDWSTSGTNSWIINIDADGIVNIPHIVKANNVNSYYQASGTSTTAIQITSLNTITQVTLVSGGTNDIKSDINNDNYSISSGGIKVAQAGTYRITASVHMTTASMTDAFRKQIFVRQGTDFSSATEILQATDLISTDSNGIQGAITIGPKIVSANANDIFFLACRFSQPAASTATVHGSFYSGNSATYLLVERVG